MLDGITVLHQEICSNSTSVELMIIMILLILALCAVLTLALGAKIKIVDKHWLLFFIIFCTVIIPAFIFFDSSTTYEWTEYKVIMSEDVNYKEFTDKYKVILQEGEIYTIQEKDKK